MTRQPAIEVVRAAFGGLERDGVEGLMPFVHAEFEGVVPPDLSAEPAEYHGHDGVRRYFDSFAEFVDDLRFSIEDLVAVDEDVVVGITRIGGRGRESEVPVEMRVAIGLTVRDGKLVAMHPYRDLDEALAELS